MGWNNSIFPLLIVTSGAGFTGFFVYSPAPGAGNLIASITAQAGTDPYGNHYAAGISSYDAFGGQVELFGSLFQLSSGLNVLQKMNPQGYVIYSPTAGAGNQVASIAPAAFTDASGNAIPAGFTSFTAGLLAELQAAALSWSGTGITASPAIGSGASAFLQMASGQTAANTVECILSLNPAAAGVSGTALLTGVLELANALATPAAAAAGPVAFGGSGQLRVIDSADGVNYGTERLLQNISGTLPQVISSTTPANIQGLTIAVSANRTYRVRGRLSCTIGGTATTVNLDLAGPAVTTMEIGFWKAQNNPGGATLFTATQTAISTSTQIFSVNEGAGNGFTVLFDGTVTFSAAGTMTLQAAEHTAAQTWQLNANSYWEVAPE